MTVINFSRRKKKRCRQIVSGTSHPGSCCSGSGGTWQANVWDYTARAAGQHRNELQAAITHITPSSPCCPPVLVGLFRLCCCRKSDFQIQKADFCRAHTDRAKALLLWQCTEERPNCTQTQALCLPISHWRSSLAGITLLATPPTSRWLCSSTLWSQQSDLKEKSPKLPYSKVSSCNPARSRRLTERTRE